MKISKSNNDSSKDLILAEISHDIVELPRKRGGGAAPLEK